MADTPDLSNLQRRFAEHPFEIVQGAAPLELAIDAGERALLERVYELLQLYFDNTAFRDQITLRFKQNSLEPQITNILNSFDQVVQFRANGSLPANRQAQMDGIQDQGSELERIITPYLVRGEFTRVLNNAAKEITDALSSTVTQANEATGEIEGILKRVDATAQKVFNLADSVTGAALGDYFHRCYNGRSIAEQEKYDVDKAKAAKKRRGLRATLQNFSSSNATAFWLLVALTLLTAIWAEPHITAFFSHPRHLMLSKDFIKDSRWVLLILIMVGVAVATGYRFVNRKYPGGYEKSSAIWLMNLFAVIALLSVLIAYRASTLFSQISNLSDKVSPLELILANAIILAVPAYAIRVCIVNYNANKHQAVLNLHRANVLRTFPLVLEGADSDEQARKVVYAALAESVFKPGATGHINRGQATDNSSQSFLKDLISQ